MLKNTYVQKPNRKLLGYIENYGSVSTAGATIYQGKVAVGSNIAAKGLFEQGLQYVNENRLEDAKAAFHDVISNYSETKYARFALNCITEIQGKRKNSTEETIQYFQNIAASTRQKNADSELLLSVQRHLLFWLEQGEHYDRAEALYDDILKENADTGKINDIVLGKAYMYLYGTRESEKAILLLREVAARKGYTAEMAQRELVQLGEPLPPVESESKSAAPVTPDGLELHDNYPNPFNASTTIQFTIVVTEAVTLKVYDVTGREITNLASDTYPPGTHSITWDGRNSTGLPVSSGIYFYRISAGEFSQVRKMLLIK